jgi:hypothetical protein
VGGLLISCRSSFSRGGAKAHPHPSPYRVDTSFDVLAVRQIDSVVLKLVAVAWKA